MLWRPNRDNLIGTVQVDETYVGGEKPGKRGRGAGGKALVGIAVEVFKRDDEKIKGRLRLQHLEDTSGDSLIPLTQNVVQPKSIVGSIRIF